MSNIGNLERRCKDAKGSKKIPTKIHSLTLTRLFPYMSDIEESLPLKGNVTKYGAAEEEESELNLSYVSSHIEDAVANHKGTHLHAFIFK